MPTTEDNFTRFVLEHEDERPERLLLSAGRWPGIDVKRAVRIIEARRKIREKLPSWYLHPGLDYPAGLPLEQCSSEATALYKQSFVPDGARTADLTGGLGADCWFMSRKAGESHYCERNSELCRIARHNFAILEERPGFSISVNEGDGVDWLRRQSGSFDLLYLDPARRDKSARRVYDISDCEPDLLEIKHLLLSKAGTVLAKISPMADISRSLSQIPETSEIHIVASCGEVKELLLMMNPETARKNASIVAADDGKRFTFSPDEESTATAVFTNDVGKYLLQASKAVRKAGAFRLLSQRFGVAKLAPSTHLYTSDSPVPAFPGKSFAVEEVLEWNKAAIRHLRGRHDRIELSAVNFPLTTDALRERIGIPGGGSRHAFATTLSNKDKILIICKI